VPNIFEQLEAYPKSSKSFADSLYRYSGVALDETAEDAEEDESPRLQAAKAVVGSFRLTYGERVAELRQRNRLALKFVAVKTAAPGAARKAIYARAQSKLVFNLTSSQRPTGIGLSVAKRVLNILAESTRPRDEGGAAKANPAAKPGQFLALLNEQEADLAWDLFNRGEVELNTVVTQLGQADALRFLNRLGWAELGAVVGTKVRATHQATELGRSIAGALNRTQNER
jgi:hypothetical protein